MKTILVINAKGGVGKTTVATNLAGYYASRKKRVQLVELDPQGCALDWLRCRPALLGRIWACDGIARPINLSAKNIDYAVIDAPAAVTGTRLLSLLKRADYVLIPVLPSPIDIRALGKYMKELRRAITATGHRKLKFGILANRMRSNTNISAELHTHLTALPYAYLTALRDSTNYVRLAATGQSIFEYRPSLTEVDRQEWRPIIRWIG